MEILTDITNTEYKNRKRLSNGDLKEYKYNRKPRKIIDCNFESDSLKLTFDVKYEQLKTRLKLKSNAELLNQLMDLYNEKCIETTIPDLLNSNDAADDLDLFVCTKSKSLNLSDCHIDMDH